MLFTPKTIEQFTLDNGFRVVLENIPERISAAVSVWVPVGSRLEKKTEMGYSHFVEHLLFKGTPTRTYNDISRQIERLGGDINASTSREITRYYIKINNKYMDTALDILSDIFFNSVFPPSEFDTEKKVILEELKMGEDAPDEYLFDVFYQNVFGNKSLGQPIAGTAKTISSSTQKKLFSFYQSHYGAKGSIISISGGLWKSHKDKKNLIGLIRQHFDKFSSLQGEPSLDLIGAPEAVKGGVFHSKKDLEQLHFALGLPGISLREEDSAYLASFTQLMGGSMSSRLFRKLREENGFCYSISSFQAGYYNEGLWGVYVGTSPAYLERAVDALMEEMKIAVEGNIPDTEVEEAISGLSSYIELSMETPMRRAVYNANSLLFFGELRDWRDKVSQIEKTTAAEIWQKVNELWKGKKMNFTSLGNLTQKQVEKIVKKYNLEFLKN